MDEFRSIRVWLLLTGCVASLISIFQTLWNFYGDSLCNAVNVALLNW